MRQFVVGIVFPVVILAFMLYTRAAYDAQTSKWHPWAMTWVLWESAVIVTSGFLGSGLHDYWRRYDMCRPPRRRRFGHDSVQLAADESTDQ